MKQINVNLEDPIIKLIDKEADEEERSRSGQIRKIILDHYNIKEKNNK